MSIFLPNVTVMTSRRPEESSNLLKKCFSCCGNSDLDAEEINRGYFGDEFTEYEYVVENLAIRKAPKALLDTWEKPVKDKLKSSETKKSFQKNQSSSTTKKVVHHAIINSVLTDSGT